MFPERLSATADIANSERRVHEALRTTLDDSFVVFHSLTWHGRGRKPDGEVDFLVAHAELGLLVIEVKGGQIAVDPVRGKWLSKDGRGDVHEIKDPYAQALAAKHELVREITSDRRWQSGRDVLMGYAVALTDSVVGDNRLPRDKPEITIDRADLGRLGPRVVECLAYWKEIEPQRSRPGLVGIESLVEMYGAPRTYTVPLSQILKEDERKIIELTNQQYGLLALLGR
ncbi:MAG TPA: nuclease-related domain-containing protein, partial [Polyangia bacterium]|nr:nuclease-related domain-containing protein [Polyangia bacterium]